jgi:hypothetical protein
MSYFYQLFRDFSTQTTRKGHLKVVINKSIELTKTSKRWKGGLHQISDPSQLSEIILE